MFAKKFSVLILSLVMACSSTSKKNSSKNIVSGPDDIIIQKVETPELARGEQGASLPTTTTSVLPVGESSSGAYRQRLVRGHRCRRFFRIRFPAERPKNISKLYLLTNWVWLLVGHQLGFRESRKLCRVGRLSNGTPGCTRRQYS